MKKVELLAPAGDLEKLKIAILYGANACFIGGEEFSLRARASNFTIPEIKEACLFAHAHNAKVHVTTNIIPHNDNLTHLEEYLHDLEEAGVDAVICASPTIIDAALKTKMEVHVSTQQSIANIEAIKYWAKKGVKRVVLARELSLQEIEMIKRESEVEIEVFIHGGMCVSYSGRCMMSNVMTDRDANRGGCAHSCRWNYDLYEGETKINDSFFAMSSKDLCAIKEIPKLISMGVDSFKIEGRMKSLYYISTVVKAYRMLIDDIYNNSLEDLNYYYNEIKKAENRETSHGFFYGNATEKEHLYNSNKDNPTKEFVGIVLDYEDGIALVEQRNYFSPNDILEVFGPKYEKTFVVEEIRDLKNTILDAARHPRQLLKIKIPFAVSPYDMLRLKR